MQTSSTPGDNNTTYCRRKQQQASGSATRGESVTVRAPARPASTSPSINAVGRRLHAMSNGKNAVSRPQQPASSTGSDAKPTHFQCFTLLVHDSGTGQRFLVDTGADISVLPASRADRTSRRSTAPLMAANGSAIRTYGAVSRIVVLNGRRFSHKFVVADVTKPILGADFFTTHKLLIDLAGRRLLLLASENSATPWILRAHPASISSAQVGLHRSAPHLLRLSWTNSRRSWRRSSATIRTPMASNTTSRRPAPQQRHSG